MAHNDGGQGVPCAFAILPNKKQETYVLMFDLIKEKVGQEPSIIVSDFETSVINAVKEVFPGAQHTGCQYHFRAAIWKNVGAKGVQTFFYRNVDFQEFVYKLYALSYVPTDDLYNVYRDQIVDTVKSKLDAETGDPEWQLMEDEINSFGTYFLNTWIGKQVHVKIFVFMFEEGCIIIILNQIKMQNRIRIFFCSRPRTLVVVLSEEFPCLPGIFGHSTRLYWRMGCPQTMLLRVSTEPGIDCAACLQTSGKS